MGQYVVVMIEPATLIENLSVSEQINEVFGPFASETEATDWTERATVLIKNRKWLITPLSDISVLNALDTRYS
jgi:hypothetical protein